MDKKPEGEKEGGGDLSKEDPIEDRGILGLGYGKPFGIRGGERE